MKKLKMRFNLTKETFLVAEKNIQWSFFREFIIKPAMPTDYMPTLKIKE